MAQAGRFSSSVLVLDLTVENSMLRFYYGSAPLLFMDEIVSKLNAMVTELIEARDLAAQRADTLQLEVESLRAELELGQAARNRKSSSFFALPNALVAGRGTEGYRVRDFFDSGVWGRFGP